MLSSSCEQSSDRDFLRHRHCAMAAKMLPLSYHALLDLRTSSTLHAGQQPCLDLHQTMTKALGWNAGPNACRRGAFAVARHVSCFPPLTTNSCR